MVKVNGGDLLVSQMRALGINEVFTLHGGHLDPILQACRLQGVRIFDTRHEQAAAHMAEGWARHTGRPGVCLVTAGPGVTDAVTGVANAMMDAVPLICIGGRSPLADDERLPLQGLDQMALMAPITKWQHSVRHVERIPEIFAMAYRHAAGGRPGPVFVEIPIEVLYSRAEEGAVALARRAQPETAPAASQSAVDELARLLRDARKPVLLAGGGVFFSRAAKQLVEFAEATRVPVLVNGKARGCIPDSHPLCCGSFDTLAAAQAIGEDGVPDLVVLLGARIGLFTGGAGEGVIARQSKIVQVDIEPEEIGRNREVHLAIPADCREVLQQLSRALEGQPARRRDAWVETLRQTRQGVAAALEGLAAAKQSVIHPYQLMREVAAAAPPGAILVADGGETSWWFSNAAKVESPGHWLSHGYLGCLGVGLPFALAAKAASPDSAVICVTGDGSVGLNLSEFHTAAKHGLAVVVVVNNDQAWGMSKHGQEIQFGHESLAAVELGPVAYHRAAEGLGAYGEEVREPGELAPALQRALASGRPACINVLTDPTAVAPVTLALYSALVPQTGEGEEAALPYYGRRQLEPARG
jgi:acetolactate synthase-1/2/3 large subunit